MICEIIITLASIQFTIQSTVESELDCRIEAVETQFMLEKEWGVESTLEYRIKST